MKYLPLPILLLLFILIIPVVAEENITIVNATVVPTPVPTPAYNNTRISQGQCVELGGTYDVSGVIGYSFTTNANTFAYYGKYVSSFDPAYDNTSVLYKYEMPDQRAAYYQFYINPTIFGNRTGYWYQYTGEYERAANKRAFYVSDRCVVQTITPTENTTNETIIAIDDNTEKILEQQKLNPVQLNPKHIADVVVARYDSINIENLNGTYQAWLFGRVTGIYGKNVNLTNSSTIFTKDEVGGMEAGSYNLLLQSAGNNKLFELSYNRTENQEMLVPLMRTVFPVEITGSQPRLVQPQVEKILSESTDDTYKIYKIEIQEPFVEINGYQEIFVDSDKSIMEVAGYTNQQPNSKIQLIIDYNVKINKSDKFRTIDTFVEKGDIGSLRTFHTYIPMDKREISVGAHDVTAIGSSGALSTVSFYIMGSTTPEVRTTYYTYIDGRPFIPTPTPITIIERPTPVTIYKTVTVTIPVTPPQESVDEAAWKSISFIAEMVALGIIGCIVVGYLIAAYIRSRGKKEDELE